MDQFKILNPKILLAAVTVLVLIGPPFAQGQKEGAAPPELAPIDLIPLNFDPKGDATQTLPNKSAYLVIQEDCFACREQLKALECAAERLAPRSVYAVYKGSSPSKVLREVRRIRPDLNIYRTLKPRENALGLSEILATPTWIFWESGQRRRLKGLIGCSNNTE